MNPPPNPQAAAANADMRAYNAALRGEMMTRTEPPAAVPADVLAAVLQRWPDMARYAHTARLEPHVSSIDGRVYGFVTVTVFSKEKSCQN